MLNQMSAANIKTTINKLVSFGTRQTLSSQTDPKRGIGAARDYIFQTPQGYAAALDTVGTAEAVDVSLAVVNDRSRIVTIAAFDRVEPEGIIAIAGAMPASAAYRDENRGRLIALASDGLLVVPVARTFPLADAIEALELLKGGHPGGKLALTP